MKRLILLLMMLLPLAAMAQDVTINSLMQEYSSKAKCSTISLSKSMLRSMGVEMGADNLRAISVSDAELIPRFIEQANSVVTRLEVVMTVNDAGNSVSIYQLTDLNDSVSDMVIVVNNGTEAMMMHIHGKDLELNKVGSLVDF